MARLQNFLTKKFLVTLPQERGFPSQSKLKPVCDLTAGRQGLKKPVAASAKHHEETKRSKVFKKAADHKHLGKTRLFRRLIQFPAFLSVFAGAAPQQDDRYFHSSCWMSCAPSSRVKVGETTLRTASRKKPFRTAHLKTSRLCRLKHTGHVLPGRPLPTTNLRARALPDRTSLQNCYSEELSHQSRLRAALTLAAGDRPGNELVLPCVIPSAAAGRTDLKHSRLSSSQQHPHFKMQQLRGSLPWF